jgi:hypothetical protein
MASAPFRSTAASLSELSEDTVIWRGWKASGRAPYDAAIQLHIAGGIQAFYLGCHVGGKISLVARGNVEPPVERSVSCLHGGIT